MVRGSHGEDGVCQGLGLQDLCLVAVWRKHWSLEVPQYSDVHRGRGTAGRGALVIGQHLQLQQTQAVRQCLLAGLEVGSGGRAVERRTVNRRDGGAIPPTAVSKFYQFRSPHIACVFRKRH